MKTLDDFEYLVCRIINMSLNIASCTEGGWIEGVKISKAELGIAKAEALSAYGELLDELHELHNELRMRNERS